MRELLKIKDREFKLIKDLVYKESGIYLEESKKALVVGRLNNLVLNSGFESYEDYYQHVMKDASKDALTRLIDQIATNHTYFNREAAHFDFLKEKVLPEFIKKGANSKPFQIWCAAASTGEEPYMLAIILLEYFKSWGNQNKWNIVATDISSRALEKAIEGVYRAEELKRLSPALIGKYFVRLDKDYYQAGAELKASVTFKKFNLINPVIPFHNKFEVIFLRNVMIYFNLATKLTLVERMSDLLQKGGYLFIGLAESLPREKISLDYVRPAVYKRRHQR